jgi:preprotein translocase subunit SecE
MQRLAVMSKQRNATADRETGDRDEDRNTSSAESKRGGSPARKKDRHMTAGAHWLLQPGLYKRNQGRIARQLTFAGLAVTAAIGCWRLGMLLIDQGPAVQYGAPLAVFAASVWVAFRLMNLPKFADFLIAVEAEMAKVSWPTRAELIRSSIVVMIVIFGLAAILALYDLFWNWLLHRLTGG